MKATVLIGNVTGSPVSHGGAMTDEFDDMYETFRTLFDASTPAGAVKRLETMQVPAQDIPQEWPLSDLTHTDCPTRRACGQRYGDLRASMGWGTAVKTLDRAALELKRDGPVGWGCSE